MKHRYQSFTRIGRQFQSLERQVYADWTSVSFPFCQRSCLIWRIMTNTLTNTMTNTYVVIFLSVSIFGRGYHSAYQNVEFTEFQLSRTRFHINLTLRRTTKNSLSLPIKLSNQIELIASLIQIEQRCINRACELKCRSRQRIFRCSL